MLYYLIDSSGDAMFMSCLDLLQASTFSFSAIKKGPAVERHDNTVINLPPISFKLQVISCVLFQNKVYVTGVATEGEVLSRRIQVYSLEEVKWSALPQAAIYNAPATIINGWFTLIGGRQTKDSAITSILCSWIEEYAWVEDRISPMPTVRLESGVCSHDKLLLVTGGIVDHVKNRIAKSVNVYNFSTKHWSTSTPEALELPKAIRSHQLVVFGGYIYLMAGATVYPTQPETGNSEAGEQNGVMSLRLLNSPQRY